MKMRAMRVPKRCSVQHFTNTPTNPFALRKPGGPSQKGGERHSVLPENVLPYL